MIHQIKTVIIDDGVNEKLYNTGGLWLNLEVTRDLQIRQRAGYSMHEPSHGTTCGAVIKKYSPEIPLGSIKVLNENRCGVREQLVTALRWCADNEIRLVNLSLGTVDFRDFAAVREAVDYAAQRGVIIIAACNNKNIYTCPASLPNVIGVKCDIEGKLKEGQYRYNFRPLDGIDITACSIHSLVRYDNSRKTTSPCNSFAAPMITAMVYDILQKNPCFSLEEIKNQLAAGAINPVPGNQYIGRIQGIDRTEGGLINITSAERVPIDIPVIAVYDFGGIESLNRIGKLKNVFVENGYNAIGVTDTCMEFTPPNELKPVTLEHINRVYNPDIILLSIDAIDKECDYFERLDHKYEIDIKILISDEKNHRIQNIINSNTRSEIILVTKSDEYKELPKKIVDISHECYIEILYRYIIGLFEGNGKLMDAYPV